MTARPPSRPTTPDTAPAPGATDDSAAGRSGHAAAPRPPATAQQGTFAGSAAGAAAFTRPAAPRETAGAPRETAGAPRDTAAAAGRTAGPADPSRAAR
ncbi:hypothetical protein ACWGR2_20010, partial [Streptomyces decoyicus]